MQACREESGCGSRLDIAPDTRQFHSLPMLLHPLVENAVNYGISTWIDKIGRGSAAGACACRRRGAGWSSVAAGPGDFAGKMSV